MRAVFSSLLAYFLTPGGVFVMGILDASIVFFLPLGLDFVVILLAARNRDLAWLYPVVAASGFVLGAAITFWFGRKVGEHGLSRLIDKRRLDRVRGRIEHSAAPTIAALALIPPPFPFTPFILAAGALRLDTWRFFATLAAVKLLRLGAASALAVRFGSGITRWTESTVFEVVVGIFIVLAIGGTIVSGVMLLRRPRVRSA